MLCAAERHYKTLDDFLLVVDSRDDQCSVLVQNIVGSEREPHAPIGLVVALISSMEEEGERQTKDSRI